MCDYIIIWSLQSTDIECDSARCHVLHLYCLQKYFSLPYDLIYITEMHCSNTLLFWALMLQGTSCHSGLSLEEAACRIRASYSMAVNDVSDN